MTSKTENKRRKRMRGNREEKSQGRKEDAKEWKEGRRENTNDGYGEGRK